jgi:Nucleoside 2-deoxyribosyltransferase/pfkB family carbohydrate kinase
MNHIDVVGGVYYEQCIWPPWDQIYGSGGRAAIALSGHVDSIRLHAYADPETEKRFKPYADQYGVDFKANRSDQDVLFEYIHSLSVPLIRPHQLLIKQNDPIQIKAEAILRFGMLEGTACVQADRCVYDPQSAFAPEPFGKNGSKATHLAIVANRAEVMALDKSSSAIDAAKSLLAKGDAEVVVVKSSIAGADVVERRGITHIPARQTDRVWKIGSGDIFSAAFAAAWGVHQASAVDAAHFASLAVAAYADSMALPIPVEEDLQQAKFPEAKANPGMIYLAGPFFTIGQRWLIDDARRWLQGLQEFKIEVFSPIHDVGNGPALRVASADIGALKRSDVVFAVLDGRDPGTLFEVGYARAINKPVYAFAQTVDAPDLKMVEGTGCRVYDDFVTALHHLTWRK